MAPPIAKMFEVETMINLSKTQRPPHAGGEYQHSIITSSVPDANHHFRTMMLMPGALTGEVYICFRVDTLKSHQGSYEAVSYAWGRDQKICRVYVVENTKVQHAQWPYILVTEGLYHLLISLRYMLTSRTLWIDQLCIEQNDLKPEKAGQLRIMRDIYAGANRTVIWLGNAFDDRGSLDSLRDGTYTVWCARVRKVLGESSKLQAEIRSKWCRYIPWSKAVTLISTDQTKDLDFQLTMTPDEESAIIEFFSRSWFVRVWPFQEVVASRTFCVMLGDNILDWECIGVLATWLLHKQDWIGKILTSKDRMGIQCAMEVYYYWLNREQRTPLLELLRTCRHRDCRRAQDKLYGILGLAKESALPDQTPQALVPDTSEDADTVYINLARYLIERETDLRLLAFVIHASELPASRSALALPSWVPDWRQKTTGTVFWVPLSTNVDNDATNELFNFSAGPAKSERGSNSSDPRHLTMQGVTVDRVMVVYGHISDSELGAESGDCQSVLDLITKIWTLTDSTERQLLELSSRAVWLLVTLLSATALLAVPVFFDLLTLFLLYGWSRVVRVGSVEDDLASQLQHEALVLTGGRNENRIVALNNECIAKGRITLRDHVNNYYAFLVKHSNQMDQARKSYRGSTKYTEVRKKRASGGDADVFQAACVANLRDRCVFRTAQGSMGAGPLSMEVGDEIAVLDGGRVPFLLRRLRHGNGYELVGATYVNGIMFGETLEGAHRVKRTFVLE